MNRCGKCQYLLSQYTNVGSMTDIVDQIATRKSSPAAFMRN